MNILEAKKDLESFSNHDLRILAKYYDLEGISGNDLLWSIAIKNMNQKARMNPGDDSGMDDSDDHSGIFSVMDAPQIRDTILKNLSFKDRLNWCRTSDKAMQQCINDIMSGTATVKDKKGELTQLLVDMIDDPETTLPILRLLLKAGADPSTLIDLGGGKETSILLEVINKTNDPHRLDKLRLLLDAGADPNKTITNRKIRSNVLSTIVKSNDPEKLVIIKLLLDAGADPNEVIGKKDWSNQRTFDLVLEGRQTSEKRQIMEMFLQSGMKIFPKYIDYVTRERVNNELLQVFIEAGADVNKTYNYHADQSTLPLVNTIKGNNIQGFELLLAAGADPNKEYGISNGNSTPLIAAVKSGTPEFVQLLVQTGADVNKEVYYSYGDYNYRGSYHLTPLVAAVEDDNLEMVRLLLELGADPTQRVNGKLPISYVYNWQNKTFPTPEAKEAQLAKTKAIKDLLTEYGGADTRRIEDDRPAQRRRTDDGWFLYG